MDVSLPMDLSHCAQPALRSADARAARRRDMKLQAALRRQEIERLQTRRRRLEAQWRLLRAIEPYPCADRFGIFDTIRITLAALTETREGTRRRHERMSAIARQIAAVGNAVDVTQRSLADLGAAWRSTFHDPVPWPADEARTRLV